MIAPHITHVSQHAGEAALAVTAAGVGVSLTTSVQIVQIIAGCVAIISGSVATLYYITKWRKERK